MNTQFDAAKDDDLTLSDFDFSYPEELVAHTPIQNRDLARLLVRYDDGQIAHRFVTDLLHELAPGSVLVFNNSKVFPSRLQGYLSSGGKVEIFLIRQDESGPWIAIGRPMRKLLPGKFIDFGQGLEGQVEGRDGDFLRISFNLGPQDLSAWLDIYGFIPLPPYIKREKDERAGSSPDRDRYQTVYADVRGSVAAPTAGLHFSNELLFNMQAAGIEIHYVSLHVGAGTFLPVKHERVSEHSMHKELYHVPTTTVEAIVNAKKSGRKVIAVGTTTLRSLEDLYRRSGGNSDNLKKFAESWHSTDIFLYPRSKLDVYRPWIIDGIVTNFHQPKSTLFMLICNLIGTTNARDLYREAFSKKYRLFSYGDASLLWL